MVRGLAITHCLEIIRRVITLPVGIKWGIEHKTTSTTAKNNLLTTNEKPIKYRNGVKRESLPYPWDEVAYHIIKYISYDGRLSVVYGYYFRLVHELKFQAKLPLA